MIGRRTARARMAPRVPRARRRLHPRPRLCPPQSAWFGPCCGEGVGSAQIAFSQCACCSRNVHAARRSASQGWSVPCIVCLTGPTGLSHSNFRQSVLVAHAMATRRPLDADCASKYTRTPPNSRFQRVFVSESTRSSWTSRRTSPTSRTWPNARWSVRNTRPPAQTRLHPLPEGVSGRSMPSSSSNSIRSSDSSPSASTARARSDAPCSSTDLVK